MKIVAYEVREDERVHLERAKQTYGLELEIIEGCLDYETIKYCEGADAVSTLGMSRIDKAMLDALKTMGIHYFNTRTVGFNHIDVAHAKEIGIRVCNVEYAPESVADFTVMLILMVLRKYKQTLYRQNVNDYSLKGLQGRTLKSMTVGVIGTGQIGQTVIKSLSGFGCKILAYNLFEVPEMKSYATYVSLEELYKKADIITLHLPFTKETKHLINEESIKQMKQGIILINTARGELMDSHALMKGIEDEKIGALGLDVFEEEKDIYHESRINDIIRNREMAYLRQFPNVVLTPH